MAEDRVAFTTGANSGIGLATVLELAHRGLKSVGTVRFRAKARAVTKAAAEQGIEVETATMDVTDAASCARTIRKYRPTVIVNNAGYSITGAVEDIEDEEIRTAFETIVVGPMRLARLALLYMRNIHHGRIVSVSSIYGLTTTPLTGGYQACKHALEGVSDALRAEVAADGVKVVLVEPDLVRTGIWQGTDDQLRGRTGSRFELSYERLLILNHFLDPIMADPSRVAEVIADAVTSRHPRARYLVGYDA
jgi:NAD(P)-dependent dehydrogenase (short-subunit alcohol dehydrogenase family)